MAKGRVPRPAIDRLLDRIEQDCNCCWLFTGYLNKDGYAKIRVGSQTDGTAKSAYGHVVSYEWVVGPIPDGCGLDHLCRNRACVNPGHLEAVTHVINVRRGNVGKWIRPKKELVSVG